MRSLYIRLICCAGCLLSPAIMAQEADSPEPAAEANAAGEAAEAPVSDAAKPDRRSFFEDDASAQTMIEDIELHLDLERAAGPAEAPAEGSVLELDVRRCVDLALERRTRSCGRRRRRSASPGRGFCPM